MSAEELLRAGRLKDSLEALQNDIRRHPSDARLRVFLFQLLAVLGQWERAVKQLQTAATLDPTAVPMAQTYRELVRCELLRREIFAGRRTPVIFGDPEPWMAQHVQALQHSALDEEPQAAALRAAALELAPTASGTLDGSPFAWIADADSRLGPMLEAVVNGRYVWVPFHRLLRARIEAPVDLRDLVWSPAQLTFANAGEVVAFIPTRYPGSEASQEGGIQLGRTTVWQQHGDASYFGLGQRMLVTDQAEVSLSEVRQIDFHVAQDSTAGSNVANEGNG